MITEKYADERDDFYQYIIYLGEELIRYPDFNIYDASHIATFIDMFEDEIKIDEKFVRDLLKVCQEIVMNSEIKPIKNIIKRFDLNASISTPFLVLCTCFIMLYEPDTIDTQNVSRWEQFCMAFYHSLSPNTYVQPSEYAGEEQMGLFAKRDIKKNERVSFFYGKVDKKGIQNSEYIKEYNIHLNKDNYFYIAFKSPMEYNARYANCALRRTDENARISCSLNNDKNKIALITTKKIRAGEEILIDYGDEYKQIIKQSIKE